MYSPNDLNLVNKTHLFDLTILYFTIFLSQITVISYFHDFQQLCIIIEAQLCTIAATKPNQQGCYQQIKKSKQIFKVSVIPISNQLLFDFYIFLFSIVSQRWPLLYRFLIQAQQASAPPFHQGNTNLKKFTKSIKQAIQSHYYLKQTKQI